MILVTSNFLKRRGLDFLQEGGCFAEDGGQRNRNARAAPWRSAAYRAAGLAKTAAIEIRNGKCSIAEVAEAAA
jgi:hypothetical protein